jgi:hypothetical protein
VKVLIMAGGIRAQRYARGMLNDVFLAESEVLIDEDRVREIVLWLEDRGYTLILDHRRGRWSSFIARLGGSSEGFFAKRNYGRTRLEAAERAKQRYLETPFLQQWTPEWRSRRTQASR